MPEREKIEPTERRAMTKARRLRIYLACDGRCKCGAKVPMEGTTIDHRLPLWMGGRDEDENLQYLCGPCDRKKTSQDATDRAKVKRLHKRAAGVEKKGPRLQSRGFQTGLSRGFDGRVKPRKTREPR